MPYPKGLKRTEESKKKTSESMKKSFLLYPDKHQYWLGKKQPKDMVKKKADALRGRKRSPFTLVWRENMSKSQKEKPKLNLRGDKHGNWKGGIKSLLHMVRHCINYRNWRTSVFIRDKYTCQKCGDKNYDGRGKTIYLEADHFPVLFKDLMNKFNIITLEQAEGCVEFWDINNGRTLCLECHNKTKPGRGDKKSI